MPFLDFRAIKSKVSIGDVLDHYDLRSKLKQSGEVFTGQCPIHGGDRSDSFRVSLAKNCFHCFSCRAHGNQLDFVVAMEKCSVKEAAQRLVEWFGLTEASQGPNQSTGSRPTQMAKPNVVRPDPPIRESDGGRNSPVRRPRAVSEINKPLGFSLAEKLDYSHPYLAERGLDEAAVSEFGVGFCNAGTLIGRIAIPMHNPRGDLIGYLGRWPGEPPSETPKYKLPKGFRKSAELFNIHRALAQSQDEPFVIVEGVFDVMHLWRHGVRRCVALLGSSMSEAQEALLREFAHGSRILLLLDEDDAGRTARAEIASRVCLFAFVRIQALPNGGAQPDRLSGEQIAEIVR